MPKDSVRKYDESYRCDALFLETSTNRIAEIFCNQELNENSENSRPAPPHILRTILVQIQLQFPFLLPLLCVSSCVACCLSLRRWDFVFDEDKGQGGEKVNNSSVV